MLVLSRKTDQKIVFPNLGVTLKLLSVRGNLAKIGIEAPTDLPILRDELVAAAENDQPETYVPRKLRHDVRNRLNTVQLAVHLFQRQMEAGLTEQAQSTFLKMVRELEDLNGQFGGNKGQAPVACEQPPKCQALVVDDDDNERELLSGFLRLSGWQVATAGDGYEALSYLSAHPLPDFVLLDMHMPRCDGAHTLRLIRRNPNLAGLTVFAVSGSSPEELGITVGEQGLDRWFPKPLNPEALLAEMNRMSV